MIVVAGFFSNVGKGVVGTCLLTFCHVYFFFWLLPESPLPNWGGYHVLLLCLEKNIDEPYQSDDIWDEKVYDMCMVL